MCIRDSPWTVDPRGGKRADRCGAPSWGHARPKIRAAQLSVTMSRSWAISSGARTNPHAPEFGLTLMAHGKCPDSCAAKGLQFDHSKWSRLHEALGVEQSSPPLSCDVSRVHALLHHSDSEASGTPRTEWVCSHLAATLPEPVAVYRVSVSYTHLTLPTKA